MRRQWQQPDRAAQTVVREGHTGPSGLILRNIAFNRAWGGVVAAARRACVRAWRKQVEAGACTHGFEPLRLTILCGNGRHRSVGAAYLLAGALILREGAAAAEVCLLVVEHPPCDCPDIACPPPLRAISSKDQGRCRSRHHPRYAVDVVADASRRVSRGSGRDPVVAAASGWVHAGQLEPRLDVPAAGALHVEGRLARGSGVSRWGFQGRVQLIDAARPEALNVLASKDCPVGSGRPA